MTTIVDIGLKKNCKNCKDLEPLFNQLALDPKFAGKVRFARYERDITDSDELVKEFGNSYPMIVLFRNGVPVGQAKFDPKDPTLKSIRDLIER